MNSRDQGMTNILSVALLLFKENGYKHTSMRQIAENAGVSLGMINHYYGSKSNLGAECIALLAERVSTKINQRIDFSSEPITYDLALTRAINRFMVQGCFRKFYIDSLHEDLFFDYLSINPIRLIDVLKKKYQFEANDDTILLYSKYIPYSVEKTLILKKEEGEFSSIPYEEIPWHICVASMSNFITVAEIQKHNARARQIADETVDRISAIPDDTEIAEFVQRRNQIQEER